MMMLGRFSFFFWFTLLLLVHEFGHTFVAYLYRWKITSITIYPFGGMTRFSEQLNRPIVEEFLILIAGPIAQQLGYFLFSFLGAPSIALIHYALLCFNLLPIVPLDGSKLVEIILQLFVPYRSSKYGVFFVSFVMGSILWYVSLFFHNLLGIVLCSYLTVQIVTYFRNIDRTTLKFLLERYLYSYHFRKKQVINGGDIRKMYRERSHIFYIDQTYYTEREILRKTFDLSRSL